MSALPTPALSLVIPTHNRSALLRANLEALRSQTFPLDRLEVIVVADGCEDDTVPMLRAYRPPFRLETVPQEGQGPAVARNEGAARASAPVLVFLDDDIEAEPKLLEAHARSHLGRDDRVVMGYSKPVFDNRGGLVALSAKAWWESQFAAMSDPSHRFTYRDMLSGNFSIGRDLFHRVGGFYSGLPCREDYELGMRLLEAGASFGFAPEAVGLHHEEFTPRRSLRRLRQEARADVRMGEMYPELLSTLPYAWYHGWAPLSSRLARRLAFWPAFLVEPAAHLAMRLLPLLERLHQRDRWGQLNGDLREFWYWRGVADEFGSFRAFRKAVPRPPEFDESAGVDLELDLREGIEAAEARLDAERPRGARFVYGRHPLGVLAALPGHERIRGAHLRPYLVKFLGWPLVAAMALERSLGSLAPDLDLPPPLHPREPEASAPEPSEAEEADTVAH